MKDIYDWVPWFRELVAKITNGGPEFLIRKAREVEWPGKKPPLVGGDDEWIDPFSFLYTLAQKTTRKQRPRVYPSVHGVFDIQKELPDPTRSDLYIFPIPPAIANARFHDGTSEHFERLWDLFRQAATDADPISAELFEQVLEINDVAPKKLSHGLFLTNPHRFHPIDGFSVFKTTPFAVEFPGKPTYDAFEEAVEQVKRLFPGCEPFEINYFLYFQGDGGWISNETDFFQVATRLQENQDFWAEFQENHWVRTSGKGSGVSWDQSMPEGKKPYPVLEPKDGDVVLVRYGKRSGRGIGVVAQNDYAAEDGLHEHSRIHVTWINKTQGDLTQDCPINAMTRAKRTDKGAYPAFRNSPAYRRTFELIDALVPNPPPPPPPSSIEHPRNQILYGPPGTGKTWSTVSHAVAIVEGRDVAAVEAAGRKSVRARFDELQKAGQVAMVTFHQNYAYEDFVEGIRPVVEDDSDDGVAFELRSGVFRVLVERAAENLRDSKTFRDGSWKKKDVLRMFLEWVDETTNGEERIPLYRSGKVELFIYGIYRAKNGEVAGVRIGGTTEQNLAWKVLMRDYCKFRNGQITSYQDIEPMKPSKSPWFGQAIYAYEVLKKMGEFHDRHWDELAREKVERRNFVLIIDEINRGNIARILGELITLVEESRRLGHRDATTVTLPYSGDEFGVPENLYIIGTMNTADRSIALLDTALRRRFEFVEMMPDADHERVSQSADGVDCRRLLQAMNDRIRFLLDREHQIGHTYFLDVEDIDGLRSTVQKQILPLLQEYFYDDWAKIAAVLAENGFVKTVGAPDGLPADLVDPGAKAWEILDAEDRRWGEAAAYRAIYGGEADEEAAADEGDETGGGTEAGKG